MQNWNSVAWVFPNGQTIDCSHMTFMQTLQAVWAMYLLAKKHPKNIGLQFTTLGNAVYARMRDLMSQEEFSRIHQVLNQGEK